MRVLDLEVVGSRRISPGFQRVTLQPVEATAELEDSGFDQWFRMFFTLPGRQLHPPYGPAEGWFQRLRAMPEEERPLIRNYTIRARRPAGRSWQIDVDFVLHGVDVDRRGAGAGARGADGEVCRVDANFHGAGVVYGAGGGAGRAGVVSQGTEAELHRADGDARGMDSDADGARDANDARNAAYRRNVGGHTAEPGARDYTAAAWARQASPGDRIGFLDQGPLFKPERGPQLIVTDPTGIPGLEGIARSLAQRPEFAGSSVRAIAEIDDAADRRELACSNIEWVLRRPGQAPGEAALQALGASGIEAGVRAYITGESGFVLRARADLRERGVPKSAINFCGYWRRGKKATDE